MVPTNGVRELALDQTKIGGDPAKAIALAIIYLGDCVREHDTDGLVDGLKQIGVEMGSS